MYDYETCQDGYIIYDNDGNKVEGWRVVELLNMKSTQLDIDGSSGTLELEKDFAELIVEQFETFKKKQASYGSGNIAAFGERGVLIRANDKLQRLINLIWKDKPNLLNDESIDDTWGDLSIYATIARLVRAGKWPKL